MVIEKLSFYSNHVFNNFESEMHDTLLEYI